MEEKHKLPSLRLGVPLVVSDVFPTVRVLPREPPPQQQHSLLVSAGLEKCEKKQ